MLKKIAFLSSIFVSHGLMAAKVVDFYQAPQSVLNQFSLNQNTAAKARSVAATAGVNNLQALNQTKQSNSTTTRYQQMYKGVPVVGAQVTVTNRKSLNVSAGGQVNGTVFDEIQVDVTPAFSSAKALDLAKQEYFANNANIQTQDELSELQLRADGNSELKLVYQVSFKGVQVDNKPVWPFFIVDAQSGKVIKQWNNIKTYQDSGPGGNEKVHEYWYGKDGLPALEVAQKGDQCFMETADVKLVNLGFVSDWNDQILTTYQYPCNNNQEDNVNGAYSPANDAYYFGHTIVNMYKDWYGINALQYANGNPMQLIMRVHFGERFNNAFWDGRSMSFGDGDDELFYPLVSLDVAGHEVTHGFTEQHSNLEYHDQSGALNESLSDMAGQASRAYLLETDPKLYAKAYLVPNEMTWGIGETIVRDAVGKALRFMDIPSSDGSSADCLSKSLAQSAGAYCAISYDELVDFANRKISDPRDRQSFIVHTASGVYNKAFYLFSKEMGVKNAYHMMIVANTKYWTPTTDFLTGACGVLYAAKELNYNTDKVKNIFSQVGVSTESCSI